MEVIKPGRPMPDDVFEGKCAYCGTVVRFACKEATYVRDPYDGDYVAAPCPACGKGINVAAALANRRREGGGA
jgi:endogenous inhibitor of DNA gyrase (YacG/DUF329 family)